MNATTTLNLACFDYALHLHAQNAFTHAKALDGTLEQYDLSQEQPHSSHNPNADPRLCTSHDLVDPWRTLYPQHHEFATFEFGIHCIDSVIMSRSLLPAVQQVGYTPVGYLANTDH